jgi:magnesium chelatase family protein
MLARCLPGLLPELTSQEALEVSMVQSVAGLIAGGRISRQRPYRDPHHTASQVSLIGGGPRAKPGEASLAHLGVLFLDELPEFQRGALEALRQPLETGRAVVARAAAHVSYPARVQLVAAMNPCRCGKATEPGFACPRMPNPRCMADYQAKISGPLIDRMDMVIEVPAVSAADLILPAPAEGSQEIGLRVAAARALQQARYGGRGLPVRLNAHAPPALLDEVAAPDAAGLALLRDAAEALRLTARGYHRVLKLARTIADLDGAVSVRRVHLAEAISYRGATDRVRAAA